MYFIESNKRVRETAASYLEIVGYLYSDSLIQKCQLRGHLYVTNLFLILSNPFLVYII